MSDAENPLPDSVAAGIVRAIPEAIIFADLKGLVRYWNRGAEEIFGFSAQEAMGQSLDLIIPERMRQPHWDGYYKAIELGDTYSGRGSRITRSLHKEDKPLYVDMSFAIVKGDAGQVIGSLAVARDATERFTAEKEMRKQIAALSANAENKA
jgi:PAS domain S-box-containing protein